MEKEKTKYIFNEIRKLYGIIYNWHKTFGLKYYKQKYEKSIEQDDLYFNKYFNLLKEMPTPENAKIEAIEYIACELLSGCMEWSYNEKYMDEISLNEVAKKILKLIKHYKEYQEDDEIYERLESLKNVSTHENLEPHYVDLPLENINKVRYFNLAKIAYSDVIENIENIGGFVVLADTNLEIENGQHQLSKNKIRFRNSKAMHFVEIKDDYSVVQLAKKKSISILSIKLKG